MASARIRLGDILLTLDRTMVTLTNAPRGLDVPVGSVALVDAIAHRDTSGAAAAMRTHLQSVERNLRNS